MRPVDNPRENDRGVALAEVAGASMRVRGVAELYRGGDASGGDLAIRKERVSTRQGGERRRDGLADSGTAGISPEPRARLRADADGWNLKQAIRRAQAPTLTRNAIDKLALRYPLYSARSGLTAGQKYALAGLFAAITLSMALAPFMTLRTLAAFGTLFFGLVVSLRIVACIYLVLAAPARLFRKTPPRPAGENLPVYTLLVPLFQEANILPALVAALNRIDYPAASLDIKLILEETDAETLAAVRVLQLPAHFDLVTVPDSQPRTKPKALNYALQFARGDFAVIYDAEDQPDPGQLRAALEAFRAGPPNLACLQARLNFYNAKENLLTRQFAIEYAALFDGLLPALERLGLPIPLGGTSNHFRMPALKWLCAWDAFNVTEDADIGMRLARNGYVCRMLDSVTMEETVCRAGPWLRQRTRWLKGFMQTYFVHMRRPTRLWRELGTAGFLGFQIVIGGMVFSALAHPVFYALVAMETANAMLLARPESLLGLHIWLLAIFNIALGYTASMALALIALRRRGLDLTLHVLLMPFYWIGISLAAYRALPQLLFAPFRWEKTEHGLSAMMPGPSLAAGVRPGRAAWARGNG